jgi:alpha-tubulin suppressor-like RCC1 family protein
VWAWGHNGRGDCGDGTTDNAPNPVKVRNLTEVKALGWGGGHGTALLGDGTVWAWGHNIVGGCGDGTSITRLEPVQVLNLTNVVKVDGGGSHNLALTEDGALWAWGRNDRGQLGDGTNETRFEPVRIHALDDVEIATFSCGYFHTLLLDTDGNVWAWGNNDMGQLGDGTTDNTSVPTRLTSVSNVKAIAGGGGRNEWGPGGHTLAVLADGTVVGWGLNDSGQLGDGTTENRLEPIEVKGLVDVQAVVAGGGYSMAVL